MKQRADPAFGIEPGRQTDLAGPEIVDTLRRLRMQESPCIASRDAHEAEAGIGAVAQLGHGTGSVGIGKGARFGAFWQTSTMLDEREKAKPARESQAADSPEVSDKVPEIGGPKGPEPTRYGDWERAGRCVDF